jgi:hypothetical protein
LPRFTTLVTRPNLGEVKPEIDRDELAEIVQELASTAEHERELLNEDEVKEVLRDLDLPAHRLDEARATITSRRMSSIADADACS